MRHISIECLSVRPVDGGGFALGLLLNAYCFLYATFGFVVSRFSIIFFGYAFILVWCGVYIRAEKSRDASTPVTCHGRFVYIGYRPTWVNDVGPETVFLYVNIVSVAAMTLIAIDTWYVNRFKKPKASAP